MAEQKDNLKKELTEADKWILRIADVIGYNSCSLDSVNEEKYGLREKVSINTPIILYDSDNKLTSENEIALNYLFLNNYLCIEDNHEIIPNPSNCKGILTFVHKDYLNRFLCNM